MTLHIYIYIYIYIAACILGTCQQSPPQSCRYLFPAEASPPFHKHHGAACRHRHAAGARRRLLPGLRHPGRQVWVQLQVPRACETPFDRVDAALAWRWCRSSSRRLPALPDMPWRSHAQVPCWHGLICAGHRQCQVSTNLSGGKTRRGDVCTCWPAQGVRLRPRVEGHKDAPVLQVVDDAFCRFRCIRAEQLHHDHARHLLGRQTSACQLPLGVRWHRYLAPSAGVAMTAT